MLAIYNWFYIPTLINSFTQTNKIPLACNCSHVCPRTVIKVVAQTEPFLSQAILASYLFEARRGGNSRWGQVPESRAPKRENVCASTSETRVINVPTSLH